MRQDVDDRALPIEHFSRLENCTLAKIGRFEKMPGLRDLPRSIAGGGSLSSSIGGTSFRDELLQFSGGNVYSFNESTNSWVDRGEVSLVATSSESVIRDTQQQTVPDAQFGSNVVVYAWEDTAGGVKARVVDYETGLIVVPDELLRSNSVRPKVIAQGSGLFIFYAAGTTLYCRRYDRGTSPTAFGPEVALAGDLNGSNFLYDVCPFLNAMGLAYRTTGAQTKFAYVTVTPDVGSPLNGFPNPTTLAEDSENCITCWPNGDQTLVVAFHNTANGTRVTARKAANLLQSYAPVTLHASGTVARNVCGIIFESTDSRVFYELVGTSAQKNLVMTRTVALSGVLGTATTVRRSIGLASKPLVRDEGVYVHATFDTPLQATYYLIRHDGFIAARMNYGSGGGLTARSVLPEVMNPEDGVYQAVATIKSRFVTEGNVTFSRTGVIQYQHDFERDVAPPTVNTDKELLLLGGMVQSYDGVSFVELGFNMFPEALIAVQSAGSIGAGGYQYVFLWEWFDNQGQLHRSAPSIPVDVTITGNKRVAWTIPTLRLTAKMGVRSAPVLAAYRTLEIGANGGDVFYRISSRVTAGGDNGLFLNNPAVDTIAFTDNLGDANILSNEILYTNGGVLENFPPEPCSAGVSFKGRIVLNRTDGSGICVYGKSTPPGVGVAFNEALQLVTDPEGGDVTALGVLDDKLVFDKTYAKWASVGEPATDTGIGGTFSDPERIATSTGCVLPRTVVRSEIGLWYRSAKGYFLLSRGLQEEDVGAAVGDEQAALTPSAGILVPKLNQIRFYHSDGACLVFDTYFKVWSVFARREAVDATVWKGNPVIFQSDGVVRVEDGSYPFTDRGVFYPMKIVTGWISLAGVQGFMRVWRLLLLCNYKSPHKLLVRIATDFEPAWKQVDYADPAEGVNAVAYGESTPYGDEPVYGGGDDETGLDSVYQARFHVVPQKCESIRLSIEDVQSGPDFGESFQLNAISLVVGAKKGGFKPHAKRSFGGE
jgi:hypothetical protein